MTLYIIYFNQQWVGDHSEAWFRSRGPLARAVVEQMRAAGVLRFAGGVEEDIANAFTVDPTVTPPGVREGLYSTASEYIGGFTVIAVADEAAAREWAIRIAQACGWPQTVRRVYD